MVLETLTPPPPSPSEALLSEIAGQKDPLLALELVGRGLREFPEVSDFQTRGVEILSALPKHEPPLTDAQLTALKPLMQGFPKNLPSAGWLGKVYLENDPGFAIPWLEAAAEAGDAKSAFELMRCYRDGRGTLKDSNKMVEWLKKASELGDPRAMVFLGMAYNNENVLPGLISRDDFEAFRLFSKAVELGFPDAYGNLGALVYSGVGTKDPPNPAKAVELFRQGADLGSHFSMRLYAKALEDGWEGVKPDSEAAKTWYVRAAKLGNAKALEWCKENNVSLETPEASPNPSPAASPEKESPAGQLGR
jgi:hypothetical protein